MQKIAMIYICTWNYDVFWNDFYSSSQKNFLPDCEKHYFVFTDSQKIKSSDNITVIKKEKLEWPYSAFAKFDYMLSIKIELNNFDYMFLFNANTIITNVVLSDVFLPNNWLKLVGIKHIWFINSDKRIFPYERNTKSKAYIGYQEGNNYFFSAISWGYLDDYLNLCETCNKRFKEDCKEWIIPIWHDESYINKYFYENDSILKKLEPKYWYPEFTFIRIKNPSIIYSSKERYWWYKYLRNLDYKYKKTDKIKFWIKILVLSVIYKFWKIIRIREIFKYFNLLK
jgi:hypothetical protein